MFIYGTAAPIGAHRGLKLFIFHVNLFLGLGGRVGPTVCEHIADLPLGSINLLCTPPVHPFQDIFH